MARNSVTFLDKLAHLVYLFGSVNAHQEVFWLEFSLLPSIVHRSNCPLTQSIG